MMELGSQSPDNGLRMVFWTLGLDLNPKLQTHRKAPNKPQILSTKTLGLDEP